MTQAMQEQNDQLALGQRNGTCDRAAFEELVRCSARGLHALLYLQTGDHLLAEDLTQETYLRAWKSIKSLSDPSRFQPWLFAIAAKTVTASARWRKRQKRTGAMVEEFHLHLVSDPAPPPDDLAGDKEQRQSAVEALRALPVLYRQALALRYLAGADYQAIGRQLSISNGSLRGILARGLSLLRQRLKIGPDEEV